MGKIILKSSTVAKIYIDDKNYGVVKAETKAYEIENGSHEIYAKSAWCGSQKINIQLTEEESTILTLRSFKYDGILKAVFGFLAVLLMLTKSLVFAYIAGIVFLCPLYYMTFGKDKYLELVEEK